ncbi:hypothetical protein C478_17204 [Natrinema thermotolerans DSM 11552]|nr:hypothetical protein C478_17204 [Natrinema thermotolerans DSM 11552]
MLSPIGYAKSATDGPMTTATYMPGPLTYCSSHRSKSMLSDSRACARQSTSSRTPSWVSYAIRSDESSIPEGGTEPP